MSNPSQQNLVKKRSLQPSFAKRLRAWTFRCYFKLIDLGISVVSVAATPSQRSSRWLSSSTAIKKKIPRPSHVVANAKQRAIRFYFRSVDSSIAKGDAHDGKRIARRCHDLLTSLGHPILGYKVCLITESLYLRREAEERKYRSGRAFLRLPLADQILSYLGASSQNRILELKRRANEVLPHFKSLVLGKAYAKGLQAKPAAIAGVFEGLGFRYIQKTTSSDRKESTPAHGELSTYVLLSKQAAEFKDSLACIRSRHASDGLQPVVHKTRIGILISLYYPEEHIKGFLANLDALSNPEELVPIFINAGMTGECEALIKRSVQDIGFADTIYIDAPRSGIYEAWNLGIKAAAHSVDYFTNFNVDDRRHPLCLEIQADTLNTFGDAQLAITDYLYFFEPMESIEELYEANKNNSTMIPVVNKKTVVYRNLPHSSPMWRSTLHKQHQTALFDESYKSAGDAEYWYRVLREYDNAVHVISLPLSLYYNNPAGISTRPSTSGVEEHKACTEPHYRHLMDEIDIALPESFVQDHCSRVDGQYLQLYAALSAMRGVL